MAIGKNNKTNGPRSLILSLTMATTTVRTVAGTYGGTGTFSNFVLLAPKEERLTCV